MNGQGFEMESRETKRIGTKHRRIVTPIPVPESFDLIKEMQKYEPISNAGQPLIVWDHTEDGYKVCDPYGNKFIDFSSGVMITNAGHGNPEIIDAIKKTLDKPLLCAYLHPTKERVEAAKAICSVSPIPDSKAFMLSAGTEAVEAAVKIARTHGKMVGGPAKKVIVSFEGAFHGRTLASQMVGGQPALKDWIGNLDPDIFQAPWPNAYDHEWADPTKPGFSDEKMFQTLLDTIDAHGVEYKNIAGIIIESYYGNLCYPMPKSYAKNLRAFCDKYDIVLMMDEIQIGCCRSGKWFGFENYDILPDLFTTAKGLSGGLPQSALVGRRELMDIYAPNTMTSTHSGSPVASAGTAANIKFLKEHNMCQEALRKGKIMEEKLKALWKQFPERISYVSGIGMAWAVTFAEADTHAIHPEFALEVTKKCNENGLTFFAAVGAGITMKLTPPLTIPDDALIEGLEAYATAVAEADAIMPAYK